MLGMLTILSYLLECVAPHTSWRERLFALLGTRSADELRRMGFTEGLRVCPLWTEWLSSDGRG